jgi:hypothetical protein
MDRKDFKANGIAAIDLIDRHEDMDHGYYIWSCNVAYLDGRKVTGFIWYHDTAGEYELDTLEIAEIE